MDETRRLTLDLRPELHRRLKMLAARRGTTMRELCIQAIEHQISEHQIREEKTPYLTAEEAPLLAELWDNEEDAVYDDL